MGVRDNFESRIESAGIHIARLDANDRRILDAGQRVRTHTALVVRGNPDHAVPA